VVRGGGGRIKIIRVVIAMLVVATMSFTVVGTAAASNRHWAHGADVQMHLLDNNLNPVGDFTYPANTPFYIAHGWLDGPWSSITDAEKDAFMGPAMYFELLIDGVVQHSSMNAKYLPDSDIKNKLFVSEYDLGMTGTHTFEGRWYHDAWFDGGTPGQAVLGLPAISVVTFT